MRVRCAPWVAPVVPNGGSRACRPADVSDPPEVCSGRQNSSARAQSLTAATPPRSVPRPSPHWPHTAVDPFVQRVAKLLMTRRYRIDVDFGLSACNRLWASPSRAPRPTRPTGRTGVSWIRRAPASTCASSQAAFMPKRRAGAPCQKSKTVRPRPKAPTFGDDPLFPADNSTDLFNTN